MQSKRMQSSSLSGRRALALLLRLGVFIVLIAVVAHWPFQSLVVYLGIVVLVSLGVVVEIWERRRDTGGLEVVITLPPDEYVDRDATGSR
ncbi:hypothetical protein [Amycolatopsis saalfeldensis]|uniref:Uncharacterized protein n=1 Tax=Amycolatopsis saalfeldensis TaxID=394193 RepID=A0A1H8YEJ5_9PSEU|nr:hypothetical protein [Amycolatopsis saalfeldensis]SEP50559.1 hypothetical protein SAMN04489732_114198 [Amycolatopsis saalfeldensis]